MAKTKGATKSKPVEDEDIELEDDVELDELDDDEVEDKPKKKGSTSEEVAFGVRDLCDLVKRKTKKEYTTKEMRTLLRKMAREDKPRITREVVAGNKSRYSWEGPDDPEVKRVLKAVTQGEIETARKETLDALKEKKAKKDAVAGKGANKKKSKAARKQAEEAEVEDDEVDEIEDFDEDEE